MIKIYPMNPRRLERLIAVICLQQALPPSSEEALKALLSSIAPYDTEKVYPSLPPEVQKRIVRNAFAMFTGINAEREGLIQKLSTVIQNRPFDAMPPIDRCLLLAGAYELQYNSSDPKIIVKEILICSDTMQNQKAGSYLSGILKSLAFGSEKPAPDFRQKFAGKRPPKIFLKRNPDGSKD